MTHDLPAMVALLNRNDIVCGWRKVGRIRSEPAPLTIANRLIVGDR
jgi:hypothetical protein